MNDLEKNFSENPGAYESDIIRRNSNPYFSEMRRIITADELLDAKNIDLLDYNLCLAILKKLGDKIEGYPSTVFTGDLIEWREEIEKLIIFSIGVGGPAIDIASSAYRIRESIIDDLRDAFVDDTDNLQKLNKADNHHKVHVRRFHLPIIAQILRDNSPILEQEVTATIITEDANTIKIFIDTLPKEGKAYFSLEALDLIQNALNEGYIDPELEEKISAVTLE